MDPLRDRLDQLRSEADLLRRRGLEREARLTESIVEEVQAALREWHHQELTVAEAAVESGYSEKSLRRMVRDGKIPDSRPSGSEGRIQIQRRHLPRKPGSERTSSTEAVQRHVARVRGS